jgi:hypothetical protein
MSPSMILARSRIRIEFKGKCENMWGKTKWSFAFRLKILLGCRILEIKGSFRSPVVEQEKRR